MLQGGGKAFPIAENFIGSLLFKIEKRNEDNFLLVLDSDIKIHLELSKNVQVNTIFYN